MTMPNMGLDDFLMARVTEGGTDAAAWTPERIRAFRESLRRLVEEYRERQRLYLAVADSDRSTTEKLERQAAWAAFGDALRLLSVPYRDHPAYKPQWSPEWRPQPPQPRP